MKHLPVQWRKAALFQWGGSWLHDIYMIYMILLTCNICLSIVWHFRGFDYIQAHTPWEIDDCPVEKVKSVSLQTEFRDLSNTDSEFILFLGQDNEKGGGKGWRGKNYMRNANLNTRNKANRLEKGTVTLHPIALGHSFYACFSNAPTQRILILYRYIMNSLICSER